MTRIDRFRLKINLARKSQQHLGHSDFDRSSSDFPVACSKGPQTRPDEKKAVGLFSLIRLTAPESKRLELLVHASSNSQVRPCFFSFVSNHVPEGEEQSLMVLDDDEIPLLTTNIATSNY